MIPISRIKKETDFHTTLFFKHNLNFEPGEFVMLWLPRLDEKPFTVSYWNEKEFGVTIEAKGKFTKKIVKMKKGDLIGVRGSYGNGFDVSRSKNVCIVAGGCGMAPIAPLIDSLSGRKVTVIQGAKSKNALLFSRRFRSKVTVKICTDDGTSGFHGFTTQVLEQELNKCKIDLVCTCGPEIMMVKVFELCERYKVKCQVSLERYMRCGFGICGACVCGKERVCMDGPVFESSSIRKMKDFGVSAQLKSGKNVELNEYFTWRCK